MKLMLIRLPTEKTVSEAAAALQAAVEVNHFGVMQVHNLQGTMVGLLEAIHFPGDSYALFGFASAVFWYGGWPFLKGLPKN
jgi:hypothetical protein